MEGTGRGTKSLRIKQGTRSSKSWILGEKGVKPSVQVRVPTIRARRTEVQMWSLRKAERQQPAFPCPSCLLTCVHGISLCRWRVPGRWGPEARTQLIVAQQVVQLGRGHCGVISS